MDHIPTDIFEDLLNDVVGNRYSGPPLAASDLRVLSGPQPQINITKVADERFTHRTILGQPWQYGRDFSKIQTPTLRNQYHGHSWSSDFSISEATKPTNRDIYTEQPSFSSTIKYMKPDNPENKNGASTAKKWPTIDVDTGSSHTKDSCATIPGIDFSKIQTPNLRDQYHGHSWSSDFSILEATRPTNRDIYTERPSFSSTIKYVKPDNPENKNGASTAKKWPTIDADAGSSHIIDRCATVPGIDTELADPECLLVIKNLLQYSYNKWRVKNYDVAKPHFWFLFENTSEEYKYYKLKLTQLLKLKNVTVDTESQANEHERMRFTDLKDSTVKGIDFLKLKKIQTSTVGTQTDLKMHMFNRSLADIIHHPPKQSPAVPELLNSLIIASQYPAPSKMDNPPEAFHKHERDVNLKPFTPGHTLQPHILPQQISAPRELLSHQSIISQNKMVPCHPPATSNAPLTSQKQKLMETIKSVTTKFHVDSKSSVDVQFSGIDEITKKALQNLAHVHVLSQEQNRGFDMLKGPAYWFLKEKLSPVYKYYRMKLTELRQARGLPDDHFEYENHSEALDVEATEPQVSEADHPEAQGSEADHPEYPSPEQKQPELKGCGNKRPKNPGSEYRQSEPDHSRPLKSEPDNFELLVTCSDDEESDAEDSKPLIREPGQPQVRAPKSHHSDEKLPLQILRPHASLLQDDLELVPDPVSSQLPQEIKSELTQSTSEEDMQFTTVKQSPVCRKRGRIPKGDNVPAKRMHPAEESTVLIKPESKKPEGSEDVMKTKSKEGTSSTDRNSPGRDTKEVIGPSPEKTRVGGPGNVTSTSTNVSKKRMTRLNK